MRQVTILEKNILNGRETMLQKSRVMRVHVVFEEKARSPV